MIIEKDRLPNFDYKQSKQNFASSILKKFRKKVYKAFSSIQPLK